MSYEDRKSTWNSRVWKAVRRGSAEEEVRKHSDRVTGAWKQISKPRRLVHVSYDPSMVPALQHGTWMDEEGLKKTCIKERKQKRGIHQPFYGTWVADFMLRQDAGKFMLGKYLSDKKNPSEGRQCRKTIGDGGGRKYANNRCSDQNRQNTISRVSAVQNSARGPR